MKKVFLLLIISVVIIGITSCSKSTNKLSNDDYVLSENQITSKNITIGSTSEEFKNAYNGCTTTVLYNNEDNIAKEIEIEKIDYSDFCYVYVPTFFIDDKAINVEEFKKKNNISSNLNDWFTSNPEYLEKHSVIYKCLIFIFQDNEVTNIQSLQKNFNE